MIETVVINCAKIEKLLRARGAEGNGLRELSNSVNWRLTDSIVKKIAFITHLRNKMIHEAYICSPKEFNKFEIFSFDVISYLEGPKSVYAIRPDCDAKECSIDDLDTMMKQLERSMSELKGIQSNGPNVEEIIEYVKEAQKKRVKENSESTQPKSNTDIADCKSTIKLETLTISPAEGALVTAIGALAAGYYFLKK